MIKETKFTFIVSLLPKGENNQQKGENVGLWLVTVAILLYAEKIAIFVAYISKA